MRTVGVLAIGWALAGAASAPAATVRVVGVQESPSAPPRAVVEYRAAAGEVNDLVVLAVAGDSEAVELRETRVGIVPGAGCTGLDPRTVRCVGRGAPTPFGRPATRLEGVGVRLGDRPDRGRTGFDQGPPVARPGVTLDGGGGDDVLQGDRDRPDRLQGGRGRDTLTGAGGNDSLTGGIGIDRLSGGGGDDSFEEGDGARDLISGGEGFDTLDYRRLRRPTLVDLARGRGPDRDRISSLESATGGQGADEIRGTAGPNTLRGNDGADRLIGRAGADLLDGDDGRDSLSGGTGADTLEVQDPLRSDADTPGPRDLAACGRGRDVVRFPRTTDRLARDCERAVVSPDGSAVEVQVTLPLRASRAGEVAVRLADEAGGDPFDGRVTVSLRGVRMGPASARVRLRSGGAATARVRLYAPAFMRLRSSRRLTVEVAVGPATFTTVLFAPARPRRQGSGGTSP